MEKTRTWNKEEKKVVLDKTAELTYNSDTVSIVSLLDARLIVTGTVTGTRYEFAKAGTVVAVNILDKDELLNKKKGRACCGGTSGTAVFQLA